MTILMLDIDGVLHPEPHDEPTGKDVVLFSSLPLLHQLLEVIPGVDVVITSDWRLRLPADEIGDLLFGSAPDLRHRFLGVTPALPGGRFEYRGREKEVEAWMRENGSGRSWVALDDVAGNYTFGSKQLYLVDHRTGLTASDLPAIIGLLLD